MSVRIPSGCRKFRPSVLKMFVSLMAGGILLGVASAPLLVGRQIDWDALMVGCESVPFTALLMAWILSVICPDALSNEGIYGHSTWGKRQLVRWQDMADARTFTVLNLTWLRIYSTDGNKITWIALFQAHDDEFCREIQRLAPADSPVLKFTRDNLP